MEAQEIFDKVYHHLKKQGAACRAKTSARCFYINGNMRCAVGVLLPDEIAHKADEFGGGVYQIKKEGLLPVELHEHVALLGDLQGAHDKSVRPNLKWWDVVELRLERIAREHKLSIPETQE